MVARGAVMPRALGIIGRRPNDLSADVRGNLLADTALAYDELSALVTRSAIGQKETAADGLRKTDHENCSRPNFSKRCQ